MSEGLHECCDCRSEEFELKAALSLWKSVVSLIASGTPVEGLKVIAEGNISALEMRLAQWRSSK